MLFCQASLKMCIITLVIHKISGKMTALYPWLMPI
ncbi:hypothetical protein HAINFHK1212_0052, partial [Haemophilus influenzae HK1212]